MTLMTAYIGRLFNSIIGLLSALVGKAEHCMRNIVRGFYPVVHMLSDIVMIRRVGMTSSDYSRFAVQPALPFTKLP